MGAVPGRRGNAQDLVAAYDRLLNADSDPAVDSLNEGWTPSGSELHWVRTGHPGGDEMTERMVTALNRFAAT